VGKTTLRKELEEVHNAGFAVDDEECAPELHAMNVPVRDEGREVVAPVAVSAHSSTISLDELVSDLDPPSRIHVRSDLRSAWLSERR
jgi:DNA-binding IclR family transcriptional regulator